MADVSVRPAVSDDAGELGRLQVETWRLAYTDVLPESVRAGLDADAAAAAWGAAIDARLRTHHVLVAMEGPWRVGFCATAPAQEDDVAGGNADAADPEPDATGTAPDAVGTAPDAVGAAEAASTVVIAPLLVEPRWGRRGHGSRLLAAAVDLARTDGFTRAVMWVPERDQVTQDFLTSAGWQPDGTVRALDTGAGDLREIRLHADLTTD